MRTIATTALPRGRIKRHWAHRKTSSLHLINFKHQLGTRNSPQRCQKQSFSPRASCPCEASASYPRVFTPILVDFNYVWLVLK
jgi:hypothetical protein